VFARTNAGGRPGATDERRRAVAAAAPLNDDFVDFCEGVRRLAQVDLLQYKRGQMERRVRSFAQRNGHPGLTPYLEVLKSDTSALEDFLDRVTINVSHLWRNPEQWDVLEQTIVPELAAAGSLRAWSAGCSYGAEAYTLAAICKTAAPQARTTILGTDIDSRIVERARRGDFSREDVRTAPPAALNRFFDRDGDVWHPKPELRTMVSFEVGDLLRIRPKSSAFDLILCRNTVIYFNEDVRDALHARLADALRPGGVLVVGATERVNTPADLGLTAAAPFTYRKA
jgi:chemotaxis protein methyltransferase CheR